MDTEGFKFFVRREAWSDRLNITAILESSNGRRVIMKPAVCWGLGDKDEGKMIEPVMTLERHEGQRLMDELWQAGLRPSEGSGSAGAFAAVQHHLDDMRKIVSKELGVKL